MLDIVVCAPLLDADVGLRPFEGVESERPSRLRLPISNSLGVADRGSEETEPRNAIESDPGVRNVEEGESSVAVELRYEGGVAGGLAGSVLSEAVEYVDAGLLPKPFNRALSLRFFVKSMLRSIIVIIKGTRGGIGG